MNPNYFINQAELTGVSYFDADNDGTVTAAEVACFDQDGDGLITFRDLNTPALWCLCTPRTAPLSTCKVPATVCFRKSCDADDDGRITPLDLVTGHGRQPPVATTCARSGTVRPLNRWQDNVDNDCNGFIDDLVGWNFENGSNLPLQATVNSCLDAHGVATSGIIAAMGRPPPPDVCSFNDLGVVAGMNWSGRLVPISFGGQGATFTSQPETRSAAILAVTYAAALGADAINASWGQTYNNGPALGCHRDLRDIPDDKYNALLPALQKEMQGILGNSVLVATAGNCAQNNDEQRIFEWPSEIEQPNVIAVTSVAASPSGGFSWTEGRGFGPRTVDVSAPGDDVMVLGIGNTSNLCSGTSFSAPMVTGAVGLIIAAQNANDPIQGDVSKVRSRLLCNATVVAGLADRIGGGGRVLNVHASVTNANKCP